MSKGSTFRLFCIALVCLSACAIGCAPTLETYTVELAPLEGSPDPSDLDDPIQTVRRLVAGLTGQQTVVEEIGENRFRFTLEKGLRPSAVARLQTPLVRLEMVGSERHVADDRPVPLDAEPIVTEADISSFYLDEDRLGKAIFVFDFTPEGQAKFEQYTTNNVGNFVMIGIEGRVVNWIPIEGPVLGSQGIIEGRFSREHAYRYLWGLRMAMIGYRLKIVEQP